MITYNEKMFDYNEKNIRISLTTFMYYRIFNNMMYNKQCAEGAIYPIGEC